MLERGGCDASRKVESRVCLVPAAIPSKLTRDPSRSAHWRSAHWDAQLLTSRRQPLVTACEPRGPAGLGRGAAVCRAVWGTRWRPSLAGEPASPIAPSYLRRRRDAAARRTRQLVSLASTDNAPSGASSRLATTRRSCMSGSADSITRESVGADGFRAIASRTAAEGSEASRVSTSG